MLVSNLTSVNCFKSKPLGKPAFIYTRTNGTKVIYSWKDYERNAILAACALKKLGVKEGDFVAIIPLNVPESFFIILGIMLTGSIPVPINPQLVKEPEIKELKNILSDCSPKLILANDILNRYLTDLPITTLEKIMEIGKLNCQNSSPYEFSKKSAIERLLIMPYTSGTTGGPKGVMLSHGNIIDRVKAITQELDIGSEDQVLSYLSLGHISELIATFFGQIKAGYVVCFTEHAREIINNRQKFKEAFPSILQAIKPTVFLAVPKVWQNIRKEIERKTNYLPVRLDGHGMIKNLLVRLIKKRLGLSKTRCFISAGSKISQDDRSFFSNLGIFIDDIYGQTETAGPLTINGKVIEKTSVTIGEGGEILVEGPNVMMGYYNNPKATAKVLKDGVFHTGDAGVTDTEGRIFYGGRISDGFKNSQGEFISPEKIAELEDVVRKINGVDEAIVYGTDKPYNVVLVFSPKTSEELRRKLETEIVNIGQGMYRLRKFLLINSEELELTPTLKVRRRLMLKKFETQISKLYDQP